MIYRILLTAYIVLSFIYAQNAQDSNGILSDKRTNNANYKDGNDAPDYIFPCGTPPSSPEMVMRSKTAVNEWLAQNTTRDNDPVHILVAWHVITADNGITGDLTDEEIQEQIDWLNNAFMDHNIHFTLDVIDRTANNEWFNNWYGEDAWPGMQALNIDVYRYMNVYTAALFNVGAAGWSYVPVGWSPYDYRNSVNLDYRTLPSTGGSQYDGDTGTHETGHHLGLYHTFETNCDSPDDAVDDTPRNHEDNLWICNDNLDSCPDNPGNDPIHNYMNYTSDYCQDEFTPGQEDRMHAIIASSHPGYLENDFYYPDLYVTELDYQLDTDGDGVFNPGETVRVRANVGNSWGPDAEGVVLTLTTADDRLTILDGVIEFTNVITPGEVSFTLLDWFEVYANEDANLGNIPCTIHITTSDTAYPYENSVEIFIALSLNQYGFPFTTSSIKSSPIVADLNNDGNNEVYFGSDDFNFYGLSDEGELLPAYPYSTSNQVRSGAAVGDVDGDGELEIIFGSKDRKVYILSPNGALEYQFQQSGYIMSAPALADMDGDGDLEIIFNTFDGAGGKIFAIHHNGVVVTGFPVNVGEIMMVSPAVQDLEGDGIVDIVSTTWGNNIWAVDASGNVKSGFPYSTADKFNCPPSIADLDGDGDMEIIAGDDDGFLYLLHHDGSEMGVHSFGGDIRGGIAIGDISGNGNPDLVFGGYDQFVHVLDPMTGTEVDGWPIDVNWNIVSAPALADVDNDGQEEIIVAHRGAVIFVFENDGSTFGSFPISLGGAIESSPSVQDLDNDGDYEILVGSSQGLKVIDIKSPLGEKATWNVHRGNLERSGYYDASLLSIVNDEQPSLPNAFTVSNNYPNPFNPSTTINISLPNQTELVVSVFDISGRLITELVNNNHPAGTYSVTWNGLSKSGMELPTGIYFLEVKTNQNRHIQKLAFIK